MKVKENRAAKALAFFAWALAVQLVALYSFTRGFFLTRIELPFRSECPLSSLAEGAELAHLQKQLAKDEESGGCWVTARYKRFMWIVVDALRYDFAAWDPDGPAGSERASFYTNRLPVLRDAVAGNATHGCKGYMYEFEADPPTVTMQRLKGLTTGSLPTFIDFRNNFHSPEIEEDNWVHQLRLTGKQLVFMGDDTWAGLYPHDFLRSFPLPSFNTRDLHTVDNGILEHLGDELVAKDWTGLIVHFLGVDHVGHTFGPSSRHMTAKLDQMNYVLSELLSAADDDTLVLIMGDHGMTGDGNHGGATEEETGAALFVLSKRRKPLLRQQLTFIDPGVDDAAQRMPPDLHREARGKRRVAQIDLVPTLSLLLGSPIPYASMGGIIPELFWEAEDADEGTHYLDSVADAFLVNCLQMWRYLESYSEQAGLSSSEVHSLFSTLQSARALHARYRERRPESRQEDADRDALREAIVMYRKFLNSGIGLARRLWTQYNLVLMSLGTGLQILILMSLCACLSYGIPTDWHQVAKHTTSGAILGLILGGVIAAAAPYKVELEGVLCLASAGSCVSLCWEVINVGRKRRISEGRAPGSKADRPSREAGASLVIMVLYCSCLFSNSFIVEEHGLHQFLGVSALLVLASQYYRYSRLACMLCVGAAGCLRAASSAAHLFVGADVASNFEPWTSLTPLSLFVALFAGVYRSFGNFWVVHMLLMASSLLLTLLYWGIELGDQQTLLSILPSARTSLPRVVYCLSAVGMVLGITIGGCGGVGEGDGSLSFSKARLACMAFAAHSMTLLVLLLGPASPLAILLFTTLGGLLIRATGSLSPKNLSHTMPLVLAFTIAARASFFFTAHHSQFSRLQLACAFIGFDEFHFAIGGVLLFMNTFGTEMTAILCLPLLIPPRGEPFALLERISLSFLSLSSARTLLTTINACVQRRHLMLWAIFAPKLVFDAVMQFVVGASLLCMWLIVFYVSLRAPKGSKKYIE